MLLWVLILLIPFVLCKKCPEGPKVCPDSATCCKLTDESYGCCPLQNAVCCEDHIHCCPPNSRCEVGSCLQLSDPNITTKELSIQDISCFGSEYVCPDKSTCCKGTTPGVYECCPLEYAVCCSDGSHCCPEGTYCDVKEGKCVGVGFITEMYASRKNRTRTPGLPKYLSYLSPSTVSSVVCPDYSQCPDDYTCCQFPDGHYGCCPYANATCCKDKLHCCPQNMQCDAASTTCFQGLVSVTSLPKELSMPLTLGITCPDNSTCPEGATCCETTITRFGCCPYDDAVCCPDRQHCCPNDFTCDMLEKRCVPK